MGNQKINLAIIGLEHLGKYHVEAAGQFVEMNLVAVSDGREEFSRLAPEGVKFYSDYREMLADKSIETVLVAVPGKARSAAALESVAAGKNIILEKPAAGSLPEMKRLEREAGEAGISIYYAFHAARAYDVEWFLGYYSRKRDDLGPVTGFVSHFHDPYIEGGVLLPEAEGLRDCWLDSGINAISVLQRIMNLDGMKIENISPAHNSGAKPRILNCSAEFSFPVERDDFAGIGVIDTNWAAGRDHKSTLLQFARSGHCAVLEHTAQKVFLRRPDGHTAELADLSRGRDRILFHYIGVFRDYLKHYRAGFMNATEAVFAYELFYNVEEKISAGA